MLCTQLGCIFGTSSALVSRLQSRGRPKRASSFYNLPKRHAFLNQRQILPAFLTSKRKSPSSNDKFTDKRTASATHKRTILTAMQKSHLKSRPSSPNQFVEASPATLGVHTLGLEQKRDGLIYVPPSYTPDKPSPLMICLHGAGSNARNGLSLLEGFPIVDESATILLAPDSRGRTWDFILGDYGPDVRYIDRALDHVFKRYNVHPRQIGIAGFSDGASYALSLGIANGLFFSHILAFSPGFMRPPVHEDTPKVYMSHGTNDSVLNIDRCARRLDRELRRLKYPLVYREFHGGHTVPTDLAQEGLEYFLGKKDFKSEE